MKRNVRGRIVWKKEENAREEREREIDRERERGVSSVLSLSKRQAND